jgi:hypothetical protein
LFTTEDTESTETKDARTEKKGNRGAQLGCAFLRRVGEVED